MTKGYILKIPNERVGLFLDTCEEYGRFAEPVAKFTHSNTSPIIVFVITKEKTITHLASARAGMNAGTGLRRLNLEDIQTVKKEISFKALVNNIDPKVKRHVAKILAEGGILPPQSFMNVVEAIKKIHPEMDSLLVRFDQQRYSRINDLPQSTVKSLALQKETINTALQLADIDRRPLLEWTPTTGQQRSFLDGLPEVYSREDFMITNDAHNFPGMNLIRSASTGRTKFQNEKTTIEIIIANRAELEEQTGADLIYYNATYNSFVMVQYKAMEMHSSGLKAEYRLPNVQLSKEIAQMDVILERIKNELLVDGRHDYRLNNNPFFIKLCPRIILKPDDIDLTPGMYFSLDHWRFLETDPDLVGERGGRVITYENVGRRINNTDFASLVRDAWIGTTPSQSTLLEDLIREILQSGKAITFAIKQDNISASKRNILDELDDLI